MKFFTITILLSVLTFSAIGQNSKCYQSEGTDFWFAPLQNLESINPQMHHIRLAVSSKVPTNFTITAGPSDSLINNWYMPSINYLSTGYWLPKLDPSYSQNIDNKAIHIRSKDPVNIYAYNFTDSSSEAATIFPTKNLGKEYYIMSYYPHVFQESTQFHRNSEFVIVATEKNTKIQITPSKVIDGITKKPAKTTYEITLEMGQIYQVQSENIKGAEGEGDLTGSFIKSDKPVAVFSGALSTTVPFESDKAWGHLWEQMPPVQSWGTDFFIVPFKSNGYSYLRILASEDGTQIQIDDLGSKSLNKGEFFEFKVKNDQPSRICSNNKILVAQFGESQKDKYLPENPFMVILRPISEITDNAHFETFNTSDSYVNVVMRTDQISTLLLNEDPKYQKQFIQYKNSPYSYARLSIFSGTWNKLRCSDTNAGFQAIVYGLGGRSYGYPILSNKTKTVNLKSDTIINGRKTIVRCLGDSITLDGGIGFDKYQWNTGDITSFLKIKQSGIFILRASVDECSVADSVDIIFNSPVVFLGNDTVLCNPNMIRLDGGKGFKTYNWSTGETSQTIQPKTSSEYKVIVTDNYGCEASDVIKLTFADKPVLDLSRLDTLVCGTKSYTLPISADKGTYSLERLDTKEKFNSLTANVPDHGSYLFKFTSIDSSGCFADTVFKVAFNKIPKIDFSIDSITCYHYNIDAKYVGDATVDSSRFTWVFGGDTIAEGMGIAAKNINLGLNRNKRDLMLTVLEKGCSNTDTIKDIKVIPDLKMTVKDSIVCQPDQVQFAAKNTESVTYEWNLGDGQFATTSNPAHIYQSPGYYNVSLKVTSEKGCTNNAEIDNMVYVAPVPTINFDLDPSVCLSEGNHEISYVGTGDQTCTYNWDLSSFDPEEIVRNPGTNSGPLVFNLKNKPQANLGLQAISKYGCKSDLKQILVKRVPTYSIDVNSAKGCAPLETSFSALNGDNVDDITFTWNFGDGTTSSEAHAIHSYLEPGIKYDVGLSALSNLTGCSNSRIMSELVHAYPQPKAEFSMDNPIVYNDKPGINFFDQSTGADSLSWDFGDGSVSAEKNPFHNFTTPGKEKVFLEVFNEYTCSDTVSHNILVAYNRIFPPNAFSPNAPNPVDREFRIISEGISPEGYHLAILSRWNDIVFETKNDIKGWDGRQRNGDYAPAGSYVWILNFTDFLGRSHRQTGSVTLVY